MSIWLWIIAAWIISYAVLDKEDVQYQHLLWMLLPVDMYGFSFFGFTVKPYMILCFAMLLKRVIDGRKNMAVTSPWIIRGLFACLACIIVNAINCPEPKSVFATFMMLVVWGCSMIYMSECDSDSRQSICKVLQATGIGYGIVFVAAYLIMQFAPDVPGIIAMEREDDGIFMRNPNVVDGVLTTVFRLRGFTIDPNTIVGTFLYCSMVSILQLMHHKPGPREIFGLVLSAACVLLSGSRMGLICLILFVLIGIRVGSKINPKRAKNLLISFGFATVGIFVFMLLTDGLQSITSTFSSNYANRSGLNDDYGRLTIWQEAFHIWINESPFLGLGIGRMQYYTSIGRSCHNSWLEALCAWGALVGGVFVLHFLTPVASSIRHIYRRRSRQDIAFWTMFLGTVGVLISLITVDNLTFSYLWFGSAMIAAITTGSWKEDT